MASLAGWRMLRVVVLILTFVVCGGGGMCGVERHAIPCNDGAATCNSEPSPVHDGVNDLKRPYADCERNLNGGEKEEFEVERRGERLEKEQVERREEGRGEELKGWEMEGREDDEENKRKGEEMEKQARRSGGKTEELVEGKDHTKEECGEWRENRREEREADEGDEEGGRKQEKTKEGDRKKENETTEEDNERKWAQKREKMGQELNQNRDQTEKTDINIENKWETKPNREGGGVLILHPIFSGSHERVLRKVGETLVRRGHRVTQIRFPSSLTQEVNSSVEVITLRVNNSDLRFPYIDRDGTFLPPTGLLWDRPRRQWQLPLDVFRIIDAHCQALLGDATLLQRLGRVKYSVAVVDVISNECSLALAHILDLPVIGFWGFAYQGAEAREMGMFQSPALVPAFMSETSCYMTFTQRLWNTLVTIVESLIATYHFHVVDSNIKKLAPSSPDSRTLLGRVEAVLVHSHWLVDCPKLLPPNVQYVGCISCGLPSPLPPHINSWVNGAKSGVIIFSLGYTGYDAASVPSHVMQSFMAAFSRLRQRVLVRFNPMLLDAPKNVMVLEWLPQFDILAHPKTVAFVSHCGQGGMSEAVYCGVPLVCVPIFADQGDNARRIEERGLGVVVDKHEITEDAVFTAVNTVLSDHRYRENTQRFSRMWREEDKSGGGEGGAGVAAGWVERVVHHGPQTHLRMPGHHFTVAQYFAIDVYMFILTVLMLPPLCLIYCRRNKNKQKMD